MIAKQRIQDEERARLQKSGLHLEAAQSKAPHRVPIDTYGPLLLHPRTAPSLDVSASRCPGRVESLHLASCCRMCTYDAASNWKIARTRVPLELARAAVETDVCPTSAVDLESLDRLACHAAVRSTDLSASSPYSILLNAARRQRFTTALSG